MLPRGGGTRCKNQVGSPLFRARTIERRRLVALTTTPALFGRELVAECGYDGPGRLLRGLLTACKSLAVGSRNCLAKENPGRLAGGRSSLMCRLGQLTTRHRCQRVANNQ